MHPLDRPIWSALTGPQDQLAGGGARAWRIDPRIGHFAAAADPADTDALAGLFAGDDPPVVSKTPRRPPAPGST